jgi:hypothetical protein
LGVFFCGIVVTKNCTQLELHGGNKRPAVGIEVSHKRNGGLVAETTFKKKKKGLNNDGK